MGLSVQPSMLVLPDRVMPSPIPVYVSGSATRGPQNGQWNLRNKTFLKPAGFNSWGLVYLPGGGRIAQDRDIETFARAMTGSLQSTGLTSPRSPPAVLKGNPHGNLKEEIDQLTQKTGSMFRSKPELLVFLLHEGANTNLYKTIKSVCEVEYGIRSQVMLVEKALKDRGQAQYLGNIGMKVKCKLGGINCRINEPLFRQSRFMMLGGDASHPSPGELRRLQGPPSYCALVGTYGQDCVAYSAVASSQ
jgi:eukaryotic translation initiation factor 2C